MFMTNYGITDKLNIMASLPYMWTKASGGTLHGFKGFQDASMYVKWKAVTAKPGKAKLAVLAVGGISTPATGYVVDLLPLSIGMGTTNLTARGLIDYQKGIFFTTIGGAYVWRGNVKLDRTSYYTTELHSTNEVQMPNLATFNFSVGIRKRYLIAEAVVNNMTTLGGFDIRKNDMPFSSNKMNSTVAGAHVNFTLPFYPHVELTADGNYVIKGRNVGQPATFGLGGLYIFSFKHK